MAVKPSIRHILGRPLRARQGLPLEQGNIRLRPGLSGLLLQRLGQLLRGATSLGSHGQHAQDECVEPWLHPSVERPRRPRARCCGPPALPLWAAGVRGGRVLVRDQSVGHDSEGYTPITVLTLAAFGLLSGEQLLEQGMRWVRPDHRPELRQLLVDMNRAVSGYIVGAFLICAVGGLVTGIITWVLGVPYFLALGLMYLVLAFLPYIGSLLVAITVSLTTLATVGFRRALIALGLFLIYQQIESHVLQPLIQRRTLQMNPLLIAIVLVSGAMVMGVLGAVLALPLAAALQVLLQRVLERRKRKWEQEARQRAAAPAIPSLMPEPQRERTQDLRDSEEPVQH